jgi:hypothetical protein
VSIRHGPATSPGFSGPAFAFRASRPGARDRPSGNSAAPSRAGPHGPNSSGHTRLGVRFRRARVVSEPLSDYIRFEHAITGEVNVSAGEDVRWLPRRRASDLCLPGNDFWLFDDRLVRFSYFSGDGHILEDELVLDPAVARMCSAAFEDVWERSIPHGEYRPT